MRCNDRDDLLQLSFTLKISIFGGLYITQSNICNEAFMAKIVSRYYIHKNSIIDACLGFKYAFAF